MKIIFIITMIFLLPFHAYGIDWNTGDEIPIVWIAASKIKDTDKISYVVYVRNVNTGSEEIYGKTEQTEMVVKFPVEGEYHVGVSTVRTVEDGTEIESENINWSNENGEATPNPFGVRFYAKPELPKGLKVK